MGRRRGRGSKEAVLGRRKSRRRIGGQRRKRVRFVVHSVGVSFEWQIDNWSLLSYDWALLSRYFCVHSSPISFSALYRGPFRRLPAPHPAWGTACGVTGHSCYLNTRRECRAFQPKNRTRLCVRPQSGLLFLDKTMATIKLFYFRLETVFRLVIKQRN